MVGKVIHVGGLIAIAAFVVVVAFQMFQATLGGQVVDCTPSGYKTPAVQVDVSTARKHGHIAEHHLFGCTFYDYRPGPASYD